MDTRVKLLRIELQSFETVVRIAGSGPSVVYVHGGFAALARTLYDPNEYEWTWEWQLAAHCQMLTYDRRGCRQASLPRSGVFDLEAQSSDLEAVLDAVGLGNAHIIGSSAGGPIAILFAATRPKKARSLILQGTGLTLFRDDEVSNEIRSQLEVLHTRGADAAFSRRPAGVEAWYESLWRRRDAEEAGTLDEHLAQERRLAERAQQVPREFRIQYHAAELKNMGAYMSSDIARYAERVTVPTLVLHGEHDRVVPVASGVELARTIPGARLEVIPGGHHGLLFENDRARELALDFVGRQ